MGSDTGRVFHATSGDGPWTLVSDASYAAALGDDAPREIVAAPGVLYVLGFNYLLASWDGGVSWQMPYGVAPPSRITAFGVDLAGIGGAYVAAERCCQDDPEAEIELRKSTDGGRSWVAVPGPSRDYVISAIAVTPSAVFVASGIEYLGLLRSTDGGSTWDAVLGNRPDQQLEFGWLVVDAQTPHALWAASSDGLWITGDDGATWRRRPSVGGPLAVDAQAHALYALGGSAAYLAGLLRSTDGGASWHETMAIPGGGPPARASWRPGDPGRMAMTVGGAVYLSGDGGRSWSWLPVSVHGRGAALHDLAIDPRDPNRLVGVGDGGIVRSLDGGRTWSATPVKDYLESLTRSGAGPLFAAGCGIQRSADSGRTWRNVLPCHATAALPGRFVQKIEIDPVHPANVYALTFLTTDIGPDHGAMDSLPSYLWRSADAGVTWKKVATGLRAFALAQTGSRLYAVRGTSLLGSDDGGVHWQILASTPDGVRELLTVPADPAAFLVTDGDGLVRTLVGGATWERFDRSAVSPTYCSGGVYSLDLSPADASTVYASCSVGLLHFAFP